MNSAAPGPIWTPLIPATMPEEKVANFGDDTPHHLAERANRPSSHRCTYCWLPTGKAVISPVRGGRDRRSTVL